MSTKERFPVGNADRTSASSSTSSSSSRIFRVPKLTFSSSQTLTEDFKRLSEAHSNARQTPQELKAQGIGCGSYVESIKKLSPNFPHLKNCMTPSRYHHHKYAVFDYQDQNLLSHRSHGSTKDQPSSLEGSWCTFRQLVTDNIPAHSTHRLVVVEELSTELIEILGSEFRVTPEFFEEHLINSGWHYGLYQDHESSTWNTRGMSKPYTSIRWVRPVTLTIPRSFSVQDKVDLVKASGRLFWDEGVPMPRAVEQTTTRDTRHEVTPDTSIIRPHWSLKTHDQQAQAASSPLVWEERASIWSKKEANCQIILLLLDPLPMINEKIRGPASTLMSLGILTPELSAVGLPSTRSTAMLDPLPSMVDEQSDMPKWDILIEDKNHFEMTIDDKETQQALPSSGIAEISRFLGRGFQRKCSHDSEKGVAESPQVLPRDGQISAEITSLPSELSTAEPRQIHYERARPTRKMGDWLASFTTIKADEKVNAGAKQDGIIACSRHRCLFRGLVPRGPVVADYDSIFSLTDSESLEQQFHSTRSTAEDLAHWLQYNQHLEEEANKLDPLELLFVIIKRDTSEVLHHVEAALIEIERDMLDDSILQDNLRDWRIMIEKIETELSRLRASLSHFAASLLTNIRSKATVPPYDISLPDLLAQISELEKHTAKTRKYLLANVSIIESKRAITESENITKLTELSFLFIPLTFSASVFSMQVRELRNGHVSILVFFLLAFVLVIVLYSLRLLTRSESVLTLKKKCASQVRATAKLQPGAFIPTRSYLIWAWKHMGLLLAFVTPIAILTVPGLVVLWKKVGNTQLDVFITLLITFDVLVAAWYLAKAIFYSDSRGLHLQYSIFPLKKLDDIPGGAPRHTSTTLWQKFTRVRARSSVRFVFFANVICLPLAFMWAQPTSIILKLVVTIVMFVLLAFQSFIYAAKSRSV